MGLNAIAEFGQRDREVTRITLDAARRLRQALTLAFKRAIDQGELAPNADIDGMAEFFEMTLAGIRMAAKGGKSRLALRKVAVFAGTAYLKSDSTLAARH